MPEAMTLVLNRHYKAATSTPGPTRRSRDVRYDGEY